MPPTGRKPTCLCGECKKCKRRAERRAYYQRMSIEERRAYMARRDPDAVKRSVAAMNKRRQHDPL